MFIVPVDQPNVEMVFKLCFFLLVCATSSTQLHRVIYAHPVAGGIKPIYRSQINVFSFGLLSLIPAINAAINAAVVRCLNRIILCIIYHCANNNTDFTCESAWFCFYDAHIGCILSISSNLSWHKIKWC